MQDEVFPAEASLEGHWTAPGLEDRDVPPVLEELKVKAQERGLWNLFLPSDSGLTQLEYAPMAELMGWCLELAPEATNCSAPDTGNMELIHLVGTEQQKQDWFEPLSNGEFRSAFAMTEPAVASSDATNIETADRAGRRRVRRQRPQVVDQRRGRPALQGADRDGQDRPRRADPPAAVDGHRPDGTPPA